MSKTRNLSDLLDANGDVKSTALDNVPASDVVNDTTPQLGGNLDAQTYNITDTGEVYVGKSTDAFATVGVVLSDSQANSFTRDGANVMSVRRNTSDGDLVSYYKDATKVGSIGTRSSNLNIGSSDTGLEFNHSNDTIFPANPSTNNNRDNAISLGSSEVRFTNLYLSNSVYLGGTGSANALDDYEEGTWTPTIANMSVSGTFSGSGRYVKVGRMVLAYGTFSATGSIAYDGSGLIAGFPFQGAVTDNGTVTYVSLSGTSASGGIGLGDFISSRFFFKNDFTTTGANQKTTFHAVYEANS